MLASAKVQLRRPARGRHRDAVVRDWFLAELALESGLRVSELSALACGDIVLGDAAAVVVRCGKGGKARVVRVSTRIRDAATRFLAWKRDAGEPVSDGAPLFRSPVTSRALTPRALQQSWERTLRQARVRHVGIHGSRHSFATHLLKSSNGNLRLVQRQLGHASIATTQVYLALFGDEVTEAVENLYTKPSENRQKARVTEGP